MNQIDITQLLEEGSTLGYGNYIVGRSMCINILLVGRSQSGKSTIVETLINPQKGTNSSGFSETRDPINNTLILTDNITNNSYHLNLIDTPGLKESRQTGELSRSDDGILKLASFCVEEQITSLNIVCFVMRACETQRLDTDVFREVINFLGHRFAKISMIVITHCDDFPENKLEKFEQSILSQDVSKLFFDYCKLGFLRFGAFNKDKINAEEEDPGTCVFRSTLKKVEKMRDNFLYRVIACSGSAVKFSQLQIIYNSLEGHQRAIKAMLKKEKDENSYANICKVQ